MFSTQVRGDFAELFETGFEGFDDFLGENVGVGQIVGFFQAFVSQPEDVEAGFAVDANSSCEIQLRLLHCASPIRNCTLTPRYSFKSRQLRKGPNYLTNKATPVKTAKINRQVT